MAAILDVTNEAALSISEMDCPATGHIIGTRIVKITHIEAESLFVRNQVVIFCNYSFTSSISVSKYV